jgi:hypothetical protein
MNHAHMLVNFSQIYGKPQQQKLRSDRFILDKLQVVPGVRVCV